MSADSKIPDKEPAQCRLPDWNRLIICRLEIDEAAASNQFRELRSLLPAMKDCGVNAVEIVMEDLPEGLRDLTECVHECGLAMLVQIHGNPAGTLYDRVLKCLQEFNCDGLSVKDVDGFCFTRDGLTSGDRRVDEESATALLQKVNGVVSQRFPNCLVMVHSQKDSDLLTDAAGAGGMGFGARPDLSFNGQVREVLMPAREKERKLDLVMDALYRRYNDDAFKRLLPFNFEPDTEWQDPRHFRIGAALTLTAAGIPWLRMTPAFVKSLVTAPEGETQADVHGDTPEILVRKLMRLRLNMEGKTLGLCGSNTRVIHKNDDGKVIAWVRWYDNERRDGVLVLVNFSSMAWRDYTIGLPSDSNWSLQAYVGGSADAAASLQFSDEDHFPEPAGLAFDLEPWSVLILSRMA